LAGLYDEDKKDGKHFTFDEMRLVEEVLIQADGILKSEINKSLDAFVSVVKVKSTVKGCRWDDIVNYFEYQTFEVPSLLSQVNLSKLSQNHKQYLEKRIKNAHELDSEALGLIILDIEISESPNVDYDKIVGRVINEAHDRIKHAQFDRLQQLTKLQEQSGTFKLHEGFNKECGLKGSKLSGGQK
jgi:hypothetical protein